MMIDHQQLTKILTPVLEIMGYELVGSESFADQKGQPVLRIYIDKPTGITSDDCARVSDQMSSILAVEGFDLNRVILEVSSPGINRRLFTVEQFHRYLGEEVQIRLKEKIEGSRNFTGKIISLNFQDKRIQINAQGKLIEFSFDDVIKANVIRDQQR